MGRNVRTLYGRKALTSSEVGEQASFQADEEASNSGEQRSPSPRDAPAYDATRVWNVLAH